MLATGRYDDLASVLAEALSLLERRDAAVANVRRQVEAGLADVKAGRTRRFENADDLLEALRERNTPSQGSRPRCESLGADVLRGRPGC